MDLFRPNAVKGEWFQVGDAQALIRHIPADKDTKFLAEETGPDGKVAPGGFQRYLLKRACYALVDTKNMRAPAEMLEALGEKGADAPNADGQVLLDGSWTDAMKAKVLGELMEAGFFGFFILECSKSLTAKTEVKKEQLGKT